MSKLGGITRKFYRETRGLKISGGQNVKSGTILTRQGHIWRAGTNVIGRTHLVAACDGEIYFTRKKSSYNKLTTYVNVKPRVSGN
jgi:ribosomal protein L27